MRIGALHLLTEQSSYGANRVILFLSTTVKLISQNYRTYARKNTSSVNMYKVHVLMSVCAKERGFVSHLAKYA